MGIPKDTFKYFKYFRDGCIIITDKENPDELMNTISDNSEFDFLERGIGFSFSPKFISELMYSGFYITSDMLYKEIPCPYNINKRLVYCPLISFWKIQTILFFDNLHISKSIKRVMKNYEFRINYDFISVLKNINKYHGRLWISQPLRQTLIKLNRKNYKAKAMSFEVYRDGELKAGEVGIKTGKIYTSCSGFHNEPSAGSVQIAYMLNYLKENNFAFCNFGTDDSEKNNIYKRKFGVTYIDRTEYLKLWRAGRK